MANTALARVAAQPELDRMAKPLGEAVVAAYRNAGDVGMAVKNALHGVWLHHPLHPALTSIPLGAWTTTVAPVSRCGNETGRSRSWRAKREDH